jgi:hypothetical protein
MDVSREKEVPATEPVPAEGNELVRSIVALTGLPDGSIRSELVEILAMGKEGPSQPDLSSMSLDDLRSAMLVYLESIHADMMASGEAGDSSGEVTES